MNTASKRSIGFLLGICAVTLVGAQESSPAAPVGGKATAQSEAGEPRANTSAPPAGGARDTAAVPTRVVHAAAGKAAAPAAARAAAPATAKQAPGADRVDLGTATVTGDREQPKVMYIVPWKRSDIGDLSGKPMNSLLEEALAPVDRDEFKREVVYYQAVNADASQKGASAQPVKQGEK